MAKRKKKLKVFDTGVYDNNLDETYDRYTVIAPTKKIAILLTKKEYGLSDFKSNKNLEVDVNDNETMILLEYNKEYEEHLPNKIDIIRR